MGQVAMGQVAMGQVAMERVTRVKMITGRTCFKDGLIRNG